MRFLPQRTALVLLLPALSCQTAPADAAEGTLEGPSAAFEVNGRTELSEDAADAASLGQALTEFFGALRSKVVPPSLVAPEDLERDRFYFDGIVGLGSSDGAAPPLILKSYPIDADRYAVTVAFIENRGASTFVRKIVEIDAARSGARGWRFASPFERRTAHFRSRTIDGVTYHYERDLDPRAAEDFVRFRDEFASLTGTAKTPLDYHCFESLDGLLRAYGFLFDSTKCNFLAQDLGFADARGARFVTGTGRADYVFAYVNEHLRRHSSDPDSLYAPFTNGMAAYFGGYSLSGDDLATLKAQFRGEREQRPGIDFLAEFKKGRKASVERHFSHYVMCAFLCELALERRGFEAALQLAHSGADGERFFANLESLLGVNEANFHATIVALIAA